MTILCSYHKYFFKYLQSLSQHQVDEITLTIESINSATYTIKHLTDGMRVSTPPFPFAWVANKNHDRIYFRPPNGSPLFGLRITTAGSSFFGNFILCFYDTMYSDILHLVSVISEEAFDKLRYSIKPNKTSLIQAKELIAKKELQSDEYKNERKLSIYAAAIRDLGKEINRIKSVFNINSNPHALPPIFEVDSQELMEPSIAPSIKKQWDELQVEIDKTYNLLRGFKENSDYLLRIPELLDLYDKHDALQQSQQSLSHHNPTTSKDLNQNSEDVKINKYTLNIRLKNVTNKRMALRRMYIPDDNPIMRHLNSEILLLENEIGNFDNLEKSIKEKKELQKISEDVSINSKKDRL